MRVRLGGQVLGCAVAGLAVVAGLLGAADVAAKGKAVGAKAAGGKAAPAAADSAEGVLQRIEGKWGKDSPAARNMRHLMEEGAVTARWLDTAIGPIAVVEGVAMLVVPPSGRSHWWVGDPTASEKPKTPEGEPVGGVDGGEVLALAKAEDVKARFDGAPTWKHVPVSPVAGRKDRVDLVFSYEWPFDRVIGFKRVPVTKDAVLWDERDAGGYALIDVDGNGLADRARLLHRNFAECMVNICDAAWYEIDIADGKGGYVPAPAKVGQPVYRKLAAIVRERLEKQAAQPDCGDLRDGSFVLYRYALLGGTDVKEVRTLLARLEASPKLAACTACADVSAIETKEERREADACQTGKKVLECLGKVAEPLALPAFEACLL